jgi:hypothetical protein
MEAARLILVSVSVFSPTTQPRSSSLVTCCSATKWHGSNCVKWHGSIYFHLSWRLKFIKIVVGIYLCFLVHMYTTFIFTNILQFTILQNEMKWSNFFFNILPRLNSNIICKKCYEIFSNVWGVIHSNMHAHPWKIIQCDTPKGVTIMHFQPGITMWNLHHATQIPCHRWHPWSLIILVNISHLTKGCHYPLKLCFKLSTLWWRKIFHGFGLGLRPQINFFARRIDVYTSDYKILIPPLINGIMVVSRATLTLVLQLDLPNQMKLQTKVLTFFKDNKYMFTQVTMYHTEAMMT